MPSKGTSKRKQKKLRQHPEMYLYEALLDNVRIDIVGRDGDDAKAALLAWLDKATNSYELKKFYLAKLDAWGNDSTL